MSAFLINWHFFTEIIQFLIKIFASVLLPVHIVYLGMRPGSGEAVYLLFKSLYTYINDSTLWLFVIYGYSCICSPNIIHSD